MRFQTVAIPLAAIVCLVSGLEKPLDKEVTHAVECSRKTKPGDKIEVHYRGTLESDGTEFDASYNRGQPLSFHVGKGELRFLEDRPRGKGALLTSSPNAGQVIKGWDEGLLDMCVGEKRKLIIQPEWAYGARSVGPIPANSVLSMCSGDFPSRGRTFRKLMLFSQSSKRNSWGLRVYQRTNCELDCSCVRSIFSRRWITAPDVIANCHLVYSLRP